MGCVSVSVVELAGGGFVINGATLHVLHLLHVLRVLHVVHVLHVLRVLHVLHVLHIVRVMHVLQGLQTAIKWDSNRFVMHSGIMHSNGVRCGAGHFNSSVIYSGAKQRIVV